MEYQEAWDEWGSTVEIGTDVADETREFTTDLLVQSRAITSNLLFQPSIIPTYQPNRIKDPIGLLVKLGEVACHPKYARFVFGYFRLSWGAFLMVSAINGLPEGFWAGIGHILQYDPTTADLSWQEPFVNYYSAF